MGYLYLEGNIIVVMADLICSNINETGGINQCRLLICFKGCTCYGLYFFTESTIALTFSGLA